jgi:hypothetical protein
MNHGDSDRMRLPQIIAAAATAAIVGTAGVSIAAAATSGGSPDPTVSTTAAAAVSKADANAGAKHKRLRHIVRHAIGLAAHTINIPRAELVKDMRAGKTVADVASDHGVQPQTVIEALVKAGQDRLDRAKASGKLSDARYQRLEQRLPKIAARFVTEFHLKSA